jgi:hypothetical protein
VSWAEFPDDVIARLRALEWNNSVNLRKRLLGERAFPIELNLKPPSGTVALKDLGRFQDWIEAWRRWPVQSQLRHEQRNLRQVGQHLVPVTLTLSSMQELIECLGAASVERSQKWQRVMTPLLALDEALYPTLVRHLTALEALPAGDTERLARVLPQLRAGMGAGGFLRALPVRGVDTKFLETHEALVADLLDALHGGEVSAAGGLRRWLGCRSNPSGWLQVRALCPSGRERLGGLSILSLPTEELLARALPATRLLIVENVQSGLALPELDETIAVFGGGQNLAWTRAPWLGAKQIGYWGDLDTWGLKFLGDARQCIGAVESVMMDTLTFERFRDRAVYEPEPCVQELPGLLPEERALHARLRAADGRSYRLEQERLDADYVVDRLRAWVDR